MTGRNSTCCTQFGEVVLWLDSKSTNETIQKLETSFKEQNIKKVGQGDHPSYISKTRNFRVEKKARSSR
ncbi:MAG: hypothetical protein LOD92_07010, partial [Bacillales bacterium]